MLQYVQIDGARVEIVPCFTRCYVIDGARGYTRTVYDAGGVLVALIGGRVCEVRRQSRGVYTVVRVLPE